jgi:hypothetical protein
MDTLNGRPIFTQLRPAIEASFVGKLADCEAAWRTTGEPLAVAEALTLIHLYKQTVPEWVEAAANAIIAGRRTDKQAEAHREAMRHVERYKAVRDLRRTGVKPLLLAAERAHEMLAGTAAGASPATIEASYKRVRSDLRKGRARGKYFFIKDRRLRDLD